MTLEYIKAETCPICQARTVSESCTSVHSNGQGFEKRSFACGMELAWSPNFNRLETSQQCPKDVNVVNTRKKEVEAKEALLELLETLDVNEKWKNHVRSDITRF